MARTAKTTPAKAAPTKGKVTPPVDETSRENRYTRSAKIIVGNLTIDVPTLSAQAEMSTSTARHCLEAWHAITVVLKDRGALTPPFAKQLAGKPQEAKAEEPVPAK